MKHREFRMAPSIALWHLLDACEDEGIDPPKSTGHIVCDLPLVSLLANLVLETEGQELDFEVVRRAFEGQPVKQVWAVVQGVLGMPDDIMERDTRLRRRAANRERRRSA